MFQLAIIIPHYNDKVRLFRCLAALEDQLEDDVEVIVCDNASTVDLSDIEDRWPRIRVVVENQKGAGPARNAGVAATTAPWLMFIDADCVAAPDWVARGREIARAGTVIGGRVDIFHETPPPMSGAEAFETVFAFKMEAYLKRDKFLGSGNLVLARSLFEEVGGFQPAVSEDKDWSQRAARAGFELSYDDSFVVAHPSRSDWAALAGKWRRLTRESYLLSDQDGAGRIKWLARAILMPVSVLAHTPRVLLHPDLTGLEKMRGWGTLCRLRFSRMYWMISEVGKGQN